MSALFPKVPPIVLGKLSKHVARFIMAEEAMTSTEYAVMLALIVCLCMGPVQSLGCNARTAFQRTSNSMGS